MGLHLVCIVVGQDKHHLEEERHIDLVVEEEDIGPVVEEEEDIGLVVVEDIHQAVVHILEEEHRILVVAVHIDRQVVGDGFLVHPWYRRKNQ